MRGLIAAIVSLACGVLAAKPKHVVFIMMDDLGHADLEWMSTPVNQIHTPNFHELRNRGIQLQNYHVQPVCSPSRAAMHTGRYPIRYGMQHYVIPPTSAYGVPANETYLPKILRDAANFTTAHTGKHHMGAGKWSWTPTYRGYESFLGFYGGGCDYYECRSADAFDMHRDIGIECGPNCSQAAWDVYGQYSTFTFADRAVEVVNQVNPATDNLFLYLAFQAVHAPDEVPASYIEPYMNTIQDKKRRTFAGMLACADEGIGNLTAALKAQGMFEDTLIIVSTDNGGPVLVPDCDICGDNTGATNWPLRGGKHSLWQGGVLGTGFISGAGIPTSLWGSNYTGLMHMVDWLPTIAYGALGIDPSAVPTFPLDGVDQWDALVNGGAPPRSEYVINIDKLHEDGGHAGYRSGDWKLLVGRSGPPDTWMLPYSDTPPAGSELDLLIRATRAAEREFRDTKGTCYIKSAIGAGASGDRYVSGKIDRSTSQCSSLPDTRFPGNDIIAGGVPGLTQSECCAKCASESSCVAFTLDSADGPNPSGWYNTTVQLFNMASDPYEHHNVASANPDVIKQLMAELQAVNATVVPQQTNDPNCPTFDPKANNGTYVPWCGVY